MTARVLTKISFRLSRAHILRTLLLVFGIALGVSGVVAIDIAKTSISKSFELSTTALTSRATHQIIGINFDIPQSLFTTIRTRLGLHSSAPIITKHVIVEEFDTTPLTLMGIDPFSETLFRQFDLEMTGKNPSVSGLLSHSNGIFVSSDNAKKHGLKIGSSLTLKFGEHTFLTRVAGFMGDAKNSSNSPLSGLVVADISLAQEILALEDRITRIDLIISDPLLVERINTLLPDGAILVETNRQNYVIRQLSKSFETSLTAFSMLALFMGIFLIYNTVSFSVTRRKKLNGTLRALGAGRGDIFQAIMVEVMIYALAGSLLGTVFGVLLGKMAVHTVCSTVSDMYFTLTVSQVHIKAVTIVKGFAAGMTASFAASVFPALNAAFTLPITLMQRSASESELKKFLPWITWAGVLIFCAAAFILIFYNIHPGIDFIGVFLIFFGTSLLAPMFILYSILLLKITFGNSFGVLLTMALQNVKRALSRTSVLIASLMVVTSVYIGIETMTRSFRHSIIDWVNGNIGGDIHVSSTSKLQPALDPDLVKKIISIPGIQGISAYNIHRIFSKKTGEVHVFSYQHDLSERKWAWKAAGKDGTDRMLQNGWIFVSEIFAQKNNIVPGKPQTVTLDTLKGPVRFNVAGIFKDFFMGGGRIIVNRETMKTCWGHDDITSIQIFLQPGFKISHSMEKIQKMIPETAEIRVVSGASIKKRILDIFNKTFIITSALQILTAIVALTGILNSVMALLLERSREIGILRACGAQIHQVGRLLLIECGLCGLISGVMALPVGLFLSWVLIEIINHRAFGWSYDMVVTPGILIQAVIFSCAAAVAAGIYPAMQAGRIDIGQTLRRE